MGNLRAFTYEWNAQEKILERERIRTFTDGESDPLLSEIARLQAENSSMTYGQAYRLARQRIPEPKRDRDAYDPDSLRLDRLAKKYQQMYDLNYKQALVKAVQHEARQKQLVDEFERNEAEVL